MNDIKINTPLGPRTIPNNIKKLFESLPILPKPLYRGPEYEEDGKLYRWFEESGKMCTIIKPIKA